jgi:hypothetical protein
MMAGYVPMAVRKERQTEKDLSFIVMARLVRAIATRTYRDRWPGRAMTIEQRTWRPIPSPAAALQIAMAIHPATATG